MKHLVLALYLTQLAFNLPSVYAADQGVVHHPAPKKPIYIDDKQYAAMKKSLPPPPKAKSAKQKDDEHELLDYQKKRTDKDCADAKTEVMVSLASFFGTADSPIPKTDIERLGPFFEQIRNDGDYFIQKLKIDYPRKRPFQYVKGLEPCIPKEVTGAYPSGHATLSKLFALVLTDIYPSSRDYLESRAKQIADHRVLSGMHHRSDVEAGAKLGELVYQELKKSTKFQGDLVSNQIKPTPKP